VRPAVRVWWNPNQSPAADATLERDDKLKSLLDAVDVERTVEGGTVVMESVRVENHAVEVAPGRFEARECLVVRLHHPLNRPVKVRVEGLTPEGQEHRFYPEAGKYTAMFWPVTEQQARSSLTRLGLVSLTRFKREAERDGYFLSAANLAEPDDRPRPRPPLPTRYEP
jgi:hypothetical protein